MNAALNAIGRSRDILPYLAAGAVLHEATTIDEARSALRQAVARGGLVLLAEEFAAAQDAAPDAFVIVLPGVHESVHTALEKTREVITRSLGVDLIAKTESNREGSIER